MVEDFIIYIFTRGRIGKQATLNYLPETLKPFTWLVVPPSEETAHDYGQVLVYEGVPKLAHKRQWALETCDKEKLYMLDDDLRFRQNEESLITGKKTMANALPEETHAGLMEVIERTTSEVPMVGLGPSQHANTRARELYCGRLYTNFCLHVPTVRDELNINISDVESMQDFWIILNILTAGKQNLILSELVIDQVGGSHADGGFSNQRTPEMQERTCALFEREFPDFVKKVYKKTKTGWFGKTERPDLTIQWKKAYKHGLDITEII